MHHFQTFPDLGRGETLSSLPHCGEQHLTCSIYFHDQKTALAILYYWLIKNYLMLYRPFALMTSGVQFQAYCLLQEGICYSSLASASKCFQITTKI